MANIKFSYLYRDYGNYKNYNYVVFANPKNIDIEKLELLIKSRLISGEFFYANEWKLPDLYGCFNPNTDPTWHEFERIEYTEEMPNYFIPIID